MTRVSRLAAILLLMCSMPAHSAPSATDKLIKSAERNLAELTRWSTAIAGSGSISMSDESRSTLYRIHSEAQRSVRAMHQPESRSSSTRSTSRPVNVRGSVQKS